MRHRPFCAHQIDVHLVNLQRAVTLGVCVWHSLSATEGQAVEQLTTREWMRERGIWSPKMDSHLGGYGGRVFTTAMACLSLEVYWRYRRVR